MTRLLLRSDGLFAQAETALRRAVATTPDDAAALLRLGDVLRSKGELREALECYRRVASLRPADRRASWLVAVLSGTALPEQPPAAAPVPFVRQTDFLPPKRCAALLALALASRQRCEPGLVIAPSPGENERPQTVVEKGFADPARRNALMVDRRIVEQEVRPWFEARLRDAFAEALPRLRLREPREYRVEIGMSAYLGGGFFAAHKDNGASVVHTRLVSFAYYFHRHPKRFSGGELLLHDGDGEAGAFTRIEPWHNSIVFFPGACLHQVAAVESESPDFGDARFALARRSARRLHGRTFGMSGEDAGAAVGGAVSGYRNLTRLLLHSDGLWGVPRWRCSASWRPTPRMRTRCSAERPR